MNKSDSQKAYYIQKHYNEILLELAMIHNDFEEFKTNLVVQKAIKMDLFQIGELFGKLSDEIRKEINPRDLKGISDIRQYIAHGYIEIKDSIIWNTLISELPMLIDALKVTLK